MFWGQRDVEAGNKHDVAYPARSDNVADRLADEGGGQEGGGGGRWRHKRQFTCFRLACLMWRTALTLHRAENATQDTMETLT